jgi:hypothetical protein
MKTQISDIRTCLLLAALVAFTAGRTPGQNTILGVLEDVPGVYAGDQNSPGVRVIFQKKGTGWEAFPSNCPNPDCLKKVSSEYPGEVVWTIGFDGGTLGQVTGRTPAEFGFYSHVGLQNVTSGERVPTVGKKSAEYGGYTDAVVYRPLVANSQSFFNDPESWKPSQLSPELSKLLRQGFRRKFPQLCKASARNESKLVRFVYRDEDIRLVKAYASNKQWVVARLRLRGAIDCNDTEAGFEIDDAWFVTDPQKAVRYLGSGMWLVDAGDYDNDGKSELLFAINRENRGGYELFYDDFKAHSVFEFSYH